MEKSLSTNGAFWHCMTLVLGLGTLTIPYTFKELGWCGIFILAALAWLSAHTAKILCRCVDFKPQNVLKFKQLESYPDIGEAAFGPIGRSFVKWILYADLVASSALFLVFCATNMHELTKGIDFYGIKLTRSFWILSITASLFPTVHMRLNQLTHLSKFGTYIMIFLVAGILMSAFVVSEEDLMDNHYDILKFQWSAAGNMVFAFSCHGTLLTIYRQMKKPEEAESLFNHIYASGFLLKALVGGTGYFVFAQDVTDQVSLNLPFEGLKIGVTLLVTLKKWLTYALPLEPVAVELATGDPKRDFTTRSILVLITCALALLLPYFGLFQALIGALCAGFLVLIFPIAFYLKLYKEKMSSREITVHQVLLAFSFVLVVASSHAALSEASDLWAMDDVKST